MFERIKENWQKKIERNAIKSVLTHANKQGVKLMKEGVSFEDLPDNAKLTETVYFKRSLLPLGDWSRIYPPINEDGSINILNLVFGGKRNLIKLIGVLGIIAMVIIQFYNNFEMIESLKVASQYCRLDIGF